jgi:HEPN domain-containing protein
MSSYDIVSFHAQQAAEKSLKAVLIRHQVVFGKTHDIGQLLSLVEPVAPDLRARTSGAEALTPYAVASRYPGVEPPVYRDEARRHLALAHQVLDAVSALLRPYLEAGRPA